jgi:hypothetical protein
MSCKKKKGEGKSQQQTQFARSVKASTRVDLAEIAFSMVSCLSTNTISSVSGMWVVELLDT